MITYYKSKMNTNYKSKMITNYKSATNILIRIIRILVKISN